VGLANINSLKNGRFRLNKPKKSRFIVNSCWINMKISLRDLR
jgi:hypothetical protein